MSLLIVTILIFMATLALSVTGFYMLVEASAERKRMRSRLEALQQSTAHRAEEFESELLREAILSRVPALNRILLQIPPLIRLQLFVQQSATRITVAALLLMAASLSLFVLVVAVAVGLPALLAVCLVVGGAASPLLWIGYKRHRRIGRFEEQAYARAHPGRRPGAVPRWAWPAGPAGSAVLPPTREPGAGHAAPSGTR